MSTTELDFDIQGMTCASCANRIERRLNKLDGVTASVNYASEKAHVSFHEAHTPEDLQQLLEHSARAGTLERESSAALLGALELTQLSLAELVADRPMPTAVGPDATAGEVREASRRDRHRRILIRTEPGRSLSHVVHVRDVLGFAGGDPIAEAARPVTVLPGSLTVVRAFETMRQEGTQLALVDRADGSHAVVTVTDVLTHLLTTGELSDSVK